MPKQVRGHVITTTRFYLCCGFGGPINTFTQEAFQVSPASTKYQSTQHDSQYPATPVKILQKRINANNSQSENEANQKTTANQ